MYTITVRRKSGRRKRAHVTTVRRACDHHMTFNRGAAMSILPFTHKTPAARGDVAGLLRGFSIEVMPRTAEKVPDFRALLPPGTRVYIAHIEGTPLDDMVRTARRIAGEGFPVMPHVPARLLRDRAEAGGLLARYSAEAGVTSALVLAGGARTPAGEFDSAMQLLETGFSTATASRGCTSRATPKATATSTRTAARGPWTRRFAGSRPSPNGPGRRWRLSPSSPSTPGR
jgi:hypothetical protein